MLFRGLSKGTTGQRIVNVEHSLTNFIFGHLAEVECFPSEYTMGTHGMHLYPPPLSEERVRESSVVRFGWQNNP